MRENCNQMVIIPGLFEITLNHCVSPYMFIISPKLNPNSLYVIVLIIRSCFIIIMPCYVVHGLQLIFRPRKSSILTNINDSNEDMVQIVQGHGFESEENLKNSIKHNIPSSIVVLDESEKQRLRYNLIQMNIQDNELLF